MAASSGEQGGDAPSVLCLLEQTLGHVTHSANLRALLPEASGISAEFVDIDFQPSSRLPPWSNWTVRAGLRARRALRDRRSLPDALFVHTQVPAVLLGRWMRRIPTVVSLDATPIQYDALGDSYSHRRAPAPVERTKHALNRRCFEHATHLVTWSEWARQGLAADYGISPDRVTAIAPGVDLHLWSAPTRRRTPSQPVRILFVGADLRRKGGDVLLHAFRRVSADPHLPPVELHLVTRDDVSSTPGVIVHRGLAPNSRALVEQYHAADIFCLPTRGDCLPMVLAEAAAAGLPLISTPVGAIPEIVRPGQTGMLVEPGDIDGLTIALRELAASPETRARFGDESRRLAGAKHDARRNASRLAQLLHEVAQ